MGVVTVGVQAGRGLSDFGHAHTHPQEVEAIGTVAHSCQGTGMAGDLTPEASMRIELERRKEAFTYLAVGICIMVVALVFLAMGAIYQDIPVMAGPFVVILVGMYLYNKGHHSRVQIMAIEQRLAGMTAGQTTVSAHADTKS